MQMTPAAVGVLRDAGVAFGPGRAADAGGVAVSAQVTGPRGTGALVER